MTPLFPGGSPLVLEWRPIRSFLPKPKRSQESFLLLSEDEQMVQLEEAYARATVAITRARPFYLGHGAFCWRCSTERTLSGRFVSPAAVQFLWFHRFVSKRHYPFAISFCMFVPRSYSLLRISSCWPTMSRTRSAMQEKKCCHHQSKITLSHHGSPWHEKPFRGSYSHGYTHVWCWACLGWPSPFLSSWWWTLPFTVRWDVHSYAPTELLPVWSALHSPGNCGGISRLRHALLQGTSFTPHCCWPVAALEVQYCPS